jgi:hypothetical protein
MIGSPTAFCTKPFLGRGVPSDVQVLGYFLAQTPRCFVLLYSTIAKISRYPDSTYGVNFWQTARQSLLFILFTPICSQAARLVGTRLAFPERR